jgi:hypothetical protein
MPRITKAAESAAIKPTTLVIDNGGWSIKAGLVNASPDINDCYTVPNCLARDQDRHVYVGAQLQKCKDFYHIVLRRPVERGMVVNWELERAIWHQTFLSEKEAQIKVRSLFLNSTIPDSLSGLTLHCPSATRMRLTLSWPKLRTSFRLCSLTVIKWYSRNSNLHHTTDVSVRLSVIDFSRTSVPIWAG